MNEWQIQPEEGRFGADRTKRPTPNKRTANAGQGETRARQVPRSRDETVQGDEIKPKQPAVETMRRSMRGGNRKKIKSSGRDRKGEAE